MVKMDKIVEVATVDVLQGVAGVPSGMSRLLACQACLMWLTTSRLIPGQVCRSCILGSTLSTPWCPH